MRELAEEGNKDIALETKVAELNLQLEDFKLHDLDVGEGWHDDNDVHEICQPDEHYETVPMIDTAQLSDEGLRRNDMGLPTLSDRTVDCVKFFGQGSQYLVTFSTAQGAGHLFCCACRQDTSKIAGNFGLVWMQRADRDLVEKHLLDLYADVVAKICCLRCHRRAIPYNYRFGEEC